MIVRQVWKFAAPPPGSIAPVVIPAGAMPIAAAMQHGSLVWWAEVATNPRSIHVEVFTIGTGWDIPEGAEHVGTVLDGALVWHVYIRGLSRAAA